MSRLTLIGQGVALVWESILGMQFVCALLTGVDSGRLYEAKEDHCWSNSNFEALLCHYKWKSVLWLNSRDSEAPRPRSTRATSPGPKSINVKIQPALSVSSTLNRLHILFEPELTLTTVAETHRGLVVL
ncbi:hypothetical protein KC19_11G034700 [Ceratodon purpureus]|uniref:Uncharacterized protein n=1 Tax=Ceratodon purpureus TaxID=3225 RepID=A0A8T0GCX8_CERPU|nr:hypothetical protein KC19_11G034700 [Ceratodon purpureus]